MRLLRAIAAGSMAVLLKATRDIALLTIGFWRGFRGDELARLTIDNTHAERYVGIKFYLGSSKGDRQNIGREYKTPSLSKLCPVEAYLNWVEAARLTRGGVFRGIDRWGNISDRPLAAHSLIPPPSRHLKSVWLAVRDLQCSLDQTRLCYGKLRRRPNSISNERLSDSSARLTHRPGAAWRSSNINQLNTRP